MKKTLFVFALLTSFSSYSNDVQLNNITQDDIEKFTTEFGVNFSHTAVAAPETDGVWGLEIGIVGGSTEAPSFSKAVNESGGKGSDLKNLFNAGAMARVHLPFEIFVEATLLPEQKVSDVKLKSNTYAVGWNFGRSLGLPFDLAAGYNYGSGELNFKQDATDDVPAAEVKLDAQTSVYWVGLSKSIFIFTPYVKVGTSTIKGDLDASADIFGFSSETKHSTNNSGSYFAAGLNLELLLLKFGLETSQTNDIRRVSGKITLDF